MSFKRKMFQILAKLNKHLLPSMAKKDLNRLSKWQKLLIAYRYYVTTQSLDD